MTATFKSDKEDKAADHKKTKAQASHDVQKPKAEEPGVEQLQQDYNDDMRTPAGVAVMPTTNEFDGHHTIDEGVDVNAPRVDPGHIRNAVAKENGYEPQQDKDAELREEEGEEPRSMEQELDADQLKKAGKAQK